ncbi:hypothetical protein E3P92_03226 [Wallemia ichthyophaga]|uniref:N-acetyltransferase domain-containing protein n=2 Tax=Wallemia ichthyophaga TaxID=245174 RepID=A0A4V6TNU3_WALIC|nr:N-alpha-acetyltransferase 50 [Wallemia ichthyophaga EXF-994]TIA70247.1 hypothetical protein E3P91_03208 [Wallemia ichthyophaga]EOR01799.1 N-alpha-acetyltransferase 50 [Wallemia ichthyophaga EXF-994]TIA79606.1 hypothetical protein E3P98_03193 [Wallemia ichthyophaga]TIA96751.1 hypothetical protein E3P95_03150 [Wallemia ichthyophaga]TIA97840.1 hypothetical protein E3P96_03316 [Wallemia ichthyophaga]
MSIKLSPRVDLASVTRQNIGTLRRLNGVILPVPYSNGVYEQVQSPELEDFCKLVYYNDIPVGSVCCKVEAGKLYIMILAVLAPYRRQGLGRHMLNHILKAAVSDPEPIIKGDKVQPRKKLDSVYMHVQKENDDAIEFYKANGFSIQADVKDYYKRLKGEGSRDAFVLSKKL